MGLFDKIKNLFTERISEDEMYLEDIREREWVVLPVQQSCDVHRGQFYTTLPSGKTMTLAEMLHYIFNGCVLGESVKIDIIWNGTTQEWSEARERAFINAMHAMVDTTNDFFNEKGLAYLKPLWLMSVQSHDAVMWESDNRDEVKRKCLGV